MVPQVPTDNLYKFCALSGIILCVATLYYGVIITDQTSQKIDDHDAAKKRQTILIEDVKKNGADSKEEKLLQVDLESTNIRLQRARFRLGGLFFFTGIFSVFGASLATYGFRNWRAIQQRQDQLLFRDSKSESDDAIPRSTRQ